MAAPSWGVPTSGLTGTKVSEEIPAQTIHDFWLYKPTYDISPSENKNHKSGKMYLFYGDSNSGKTFTSGTWFDHECSSCRAKLISPQKGQITKCPLCQCETITNRPIVLIDFELGRAEMMKTEQFPNKKMLIVEPRVLNEDYDPLSEDDATDTIGTEENYINFLMAMLKAIKAGEILPSCIITDSATEVWSIIQEWGLQQLIRNSPNYTKSNAALMRTEIQTDWKVMNNRHHKLIQICRAIMRYGVDIVWTARYDGPPAYVKDGTQKIRAQKDVPFYSDIRVHMEHRVIEGQVKKNIFTSHIEKLGSLEAPATSIDRLSYAKIQKAYSSAREAHNEALSEDVEAIVVVD